MKHYFYKMKRVGKLGARSLIEHKLRSFLTALGIIFGVSSVIAMLAIGEGASFEAREQIRSMGSTNIIIRSRKPEDDGDSSKVQRLSIYGLTYKDVMRIRTLYPDVQIHIPAREISTRLRYGDKRLPGKVIGTVPWFLSKSPLRMGHGRFIDAHDVDSVSNAVVLTEATARALMPLEYPLGQNIYLGGMSFKVVGVVSGSENVSGDKGKKAGKDVYEVYISISSARQRFGETIVKQETGSMTMERVELHQLTLTAPSDEAVVPLANSVRNTLQHYRKEPDFEITVPLELLKQAEQTKRIFNIVLGSIAAISLLVGGIGIMNIMLASVTERTLEIGIRRALGATRGDIVLQFLTEASLLSIAGGIIGVGLGISVPLLVTHFAGLTTIVQMDSLILAFSISMVTGVVFGLYPATRAAALSPIEALRHE
ncbi:MAG: FtsX-like permease family protein [Oligosphaeraceae bacterium]|nr:FtsX-like permease family protein [Oligosphaeraceae bacterium]